MASQEMDLILKIVDRGFPEMGKRYGHYACKLDMIMDIEAVHKNCPLNLQKLLDADDSNFYHDITGIFSNLNRKTKRLENCFLPRFAK